MNTSIINAFRLVLLGVLLPAARSVAVAQTKDIAEQPGIYFPQAPRPGEWRRSLGVVFTSTPPELTEEVRISVPAIDFDLQRGLSKHLFLNARVQSQFVQNNLSLGFRWATPLTERLFVSAGYDVSGWLGALQIKDVFNSQAYGIQHFPNVSAGYRLTKDLQLTTRFETILDSYYHSNVGSLAIDDKQLALNGYAISFILEQPFFKQQHVLIGFRAAYSNFNWQFWSLYDTFDRNLLYPQLLFGFIW
ncbi:hypothetical protein ACFSUS_17275 [Spirosoma soli]|uniref:Outer membrane beta-barrel protein n=1 Tax=Spirosoma soli TaxID=1770529 RepID=A0ABW5M621_9BACT